MKRRSRLTPAGAQDRTTAHVSGNRLAADPFPSNPMVAKWLDRRDRSAARRATLEQVANILGFFIVLVLLLVQFSVGALRRYTFADEVVSAIIVTTLVTVVLLLILPDLTTKLMGRFMHMTGRRITDLVVNTMLAVLFVVTLPFARLFGRRGFVRNHPGGAAWADPGTGHAGRSTWVVKSFEAEQINRRGRSTMVRVVVFFVGQRNWFLLAVVLVLLLIASFLALASSPVITPFIYPLF
jgi:hypothetical protein